MPESGFEGKPIPDLNPRILNSEQSPSGLAHAGMLDAMANSIDTAQVPSGTNGWREIRFDSIDDAVAEIERVAMADRDGRLKRCGNWTAGQIFGHLSSWIDYAFDGYPSEMKPPWIIRFILKFQKHKFIKGPMPRGVKIPRVPGGTYATEAISTEDGRSRVVNSFERLRREKPARASPIFGEMTHEEWAQLNLRHAELHLGFVRYS